MYVSVLCHDLCKLLMLRCGFLVYVFILHCTRIDQNINMCESPTCSEVVKGHLSCVKCPSEHGIQTCRRIFKIFDIGLVICSCTYLKFYAALVN